MIRRNSMRFHTFSYISLLISSFSLPFRYPFDIPSIFLRYLFYSLAKFATPSLPLRNIFDIPSVFFSYLFSTDLLCILSKHFPPFCFPLFSPFSVPLIPINTLTYHSYLTLLVLVQPKIKSNIIRNCSYTRFVCLIL